MTAEYPPPHEVAAEADRLVQQGWAYHQAGKFASALEPLRQSLGISRRLNDLRRAGVAELLLAATYGDMGDCREAIKWYQQALASSETISDAGMECRALMGIGLCCQTLEDWETAIEYCQRTLTVAQRVGDRDAAVWALHCLGAAHHRQADAQEQSRGPAPDLGGSDSPAPWTGEEQESDADASAAWQVVLEGMELVEQGRLNEALETFHRALAACVVEGNAVLEGATLNNIGSVYRKQGQHDWALESYEQALSVFREAREKQLLPVTLHNIAVARAYAGQYEEAIEGYEQALAIAGQLGERAMEANILRNAGEAYHALDRDDEALEYFRRSLGVARKTHDHASISAALRSIGDIYASRANQYRSLDALSMLRKGVESLNAGRPDEALEPLRAACTIFRAVAKRPRDEEDSEDPAATGRKGAATALIALARAHSELGQYTEARRYCHEALSISSAIGSGSLSGTIYQQTGEVYLNLGLFSGALGFFQSALDCYRSIADQEEEAKTLAKIGLTHIRLNRYEEALEYYQTALMIVKESNDLAGEATLLNNIAVIYQNLDQTQEALATLQRSLSVQREVGNRAEQSRVLSNLGGVYLRLGDREKAREFFDEALRVSRTAGDGEQLERARHGLHATENAFAYLGGPPVASRLLSEGLQSVVDGQNREALRAFERALTIFEQDGYNFGVALCLFGMGQAHDDLGQFHQSLDFYQQALEIFRAYGSPVKGESVDVFAFLAFDNAEATTLQKIGQAQLNVGRYQEALHSFTQALEIYQQAKAEEAQARCLHLIGSAYSYLSEYQLALASYDQALVLAAETRDRHQEAAITSAVGIVYTSLGQPQKALRFFRHALDISREADDLDQEAATLLSAGQAYEKLVSHAEAQETWELALRISREKHERRLEGTILNSLGIVYAQQGLYQHALEAHLQSLAISRELSHLHNEGYTLNNLGYVYALMGRNTQAQEYYQKALAVSRQINDRTLAVLALSNLGELLFQAGREEEAERTLYSAVEIQETLRAGLADENKVSLLDQQLSTYLRLQQVLVARKDFEAALEVAERGRARAFVELLAQRRNTSGAEIPLPAPLSIHQIKETAIQSGAFLVEYSIVRFENALYIWVVKPGGEVEFRRTDLSRFKAQRLDIGHLTREGPTGMDPQALRDLHAALVADITDLLPNDRRARVIFIPFGELFFIPFACLVDGGGTYLIDLHTILVAPSIQVLRLTGRQGAPASAEELQPALVAGNPKMPAIPLTDPPVRLDPLYGAEAEARVIASLLGAEAVTGEAASKENVVRRMPEARLIHLATHALLGDVRQLGVPGAIALGPGPGDDGFLAPDEILSMRLNARLVVLSACSTAQGRITGDGIIGLSRSFAIAGTPAIVVSLWPVDDLSTAFLMVRFYQEFRGGSPAPDALSNAQRWLRDITKQQLFDWIRAENLNLSQNKREELKDALHALGPDDRPYCSLYYWAPFCIIGQ